MVNDMEQQVITLEFINGYWTVCSGKPIASFASLKAAIAAAPEAKIVNARSVAA